MDKTKILNFEDIKNEVRERLTLDGRNKVFDEGKKLSSEFMKESAEPEAFTKDFVIKKVIDLLELETLSEKQFETPTGKDRSVDYRIKNQKGDRFLVEAKSINADLYDKSKDGAVNQIKGLFRLAEVKENYKFGVATDGFKWVFIDENGEIADELSLENNFEEIKEFLAGREKVISRKTEEEISKKFYDWYNALLHGGRYKDHEGNIKSISEQDCFVNNVLSVKEQADKEQIAQVVMNRLIFIKFLQSKNVIGEDVLKYLSELEDDVIHLKLRQLFFAVLNAPVDERSNVQKFGNIPYLNGSLFTPTDVEKTNADYVIRAEILRKVIEFLDSFKFVHKESFENKYSLDPEILGYIFERAMTATDRKGTGAYYTPKQITKYISENTIYPLLIDKVNEFLVKEKGYKETELIENIDKLFILSETTLEDIWIRILMEIKVLDNACGSGAFLLAAANILFDLNKRVAERLGTKKDEDIGIKKSILINNIFGVDLNPNATEIAKLRLWLWLVDSYDSEHIQPLPNIDYNIRCGNSLIGYTDINKFETTQVTQMTLADFEDSDKSSLRNLLNERINLLKNYKPASGTEAKELKDKIHRMNEEIRNLLNTNLYKEFQENNIKISTTEFLDLNPFHWGFEFYSVMESGGFDVVIGNPPYVNAWEMEKSDPLSRKILPILYSGKFKLKSHWDLYIPFILQSKNIAKNGGYFSYILPNPICREKYAIDIRRNILENNTIKKLLTSGERNVFIGVSRQSIVFVLKLVPSKDKTNEIIVQYIDEKDKIETISKPQQKTWYDSHQSQFRYELDSKKLEILDKIDGNKIRLGNIYYVNYGAQISSKKKGEFGKQYLLTKEPKENPKKFFEGKDLSRFGIRDRGLTLDYMPRIIYGPRVPELFESPKIVVRKISGANESIFGSIDFQKRYCDDGLILATDYKNLKPEDRTKFKGYDIIENHDYSLEFILAILNSKLMSFFYKNVYATGSLQGSYSHVYPQHVRDFPIPKAPKNQKPFIELADKMLSLNERLKEIKDDPIEKVKIEGEIRERDKEID